MARSRNLAAKASVVVGAVLFLVSATISWQQESTRLSETLLWVGFILVLAPSLGVFVRSRP